MHSTPPLKNVRERGFNSGPARAGVLLKKLSRDSEPRATARISKSVSLSRDGAQRTHRRDEALVLKSLSWNPSLKRCAHALRRLYGDDDQYQPTSSELDSSNPPMAAR